MRDDTQNVQTKCPDNDAFPVLRAKAVRMDAGGLFCLNDIWTAAGAPTSQRLAGWLRSATAQRIAGALAKRVAREPHSGLPPQIMSTSKGVNGVTFAHFVVAVAYAEYLDVDLAVEAREVFLRKRTADASLVEDVLECAKLEGNRQGAARALGRVSRGKFTDVLQAHGVVQPYFAFCTDTVYRTIFGKPAAALKKALGVPAGGSLRDAMSVTDLTAVAFAESLSADRIGAADCQGGPACQKATGAASRSVRHVLDAEKRAMAVTTISSPANDSGPEKAA